MQIAHPSFQRVSSSRVSAAVVEQIRQAILSGRLRPGDRLPSQRELAETFGVGRSALLEALRVLEKSGLIVIRTGGTGGAFVTAPSIEQVSESLDLLFRRQGANMEELGEFRAVLEGHCGLLAAERATEGELAEVAGRFQQLKAWRTAPGVSWDDFIREEIDLHFALAGLCHNRVTMSALAALRHFVLSFSAYLPETFEGRILADWEAILGALARRDGETVKQGIREHILYFDKLIQHTTERIEA